MNGAIPIENNSLDSIELNNDSILLYSDISDEIYAAFRPGAQLNQHNLLPNTKLPGIYMVMEEALEW